MRRACAALVLGLSLTACGTTVPVGQQSAVSSDGLGPATATDPSSDLATTAPQGTLDGSLTSSAGQPRSQATITAPTAGPSADVPPTSAATSVGSAASRTPIRVGVIYTPGVDAIAKSFGVSGLSTGDTKAQAAAVIGWINAHGGLGGHPVAPVYYNKAASNDLDAAAQTACTSLTQDSHVRYVFTIESLRPVSLPCYAKAGVGVLDDESGASSTYLTKYAANLAAPGEFGNERMITTLVNDLWSRGWLTATSKVGSFAYDTQDGAVLVAALNKALATKGLKNVADERVSDSASSVSQASGAALKFRAANVDRIIPVGASPLFVMTAASTQGYHPAYALSSGFGPGALLEGTAPKDQLTNAAGIGWQPFLDIGSGTRPPPVSSRETLCFSIMKAAGQAATGATEKGFQAQVCNALLYLKDAADAVPSVPLDLLTQARRILGSKVTPADTFRIDVTNHVDGAVGFRSLAFVQSCSCFQYVSPVKVAP